MSFLVFKADHTIYIREIGSATIYASEPTLMKAIKFLLTQYPDLPKVLIIDSSVAEKGEGR